MYFVIDPASGQKFGPADVATLNRWAQEGRLTAQSMFEDAATGQQMSAAQVPGLVLAAPAADPVIQAPKPAAPEMPPMGEAYSGPSRPAPGPFSNPPVGYAPVPVASNTMTISWVLIIVGICCWCFIEPIGLYFAFKGKAEGQKSAQAAIIVSCCIIALGLISTIIRWQSIMEQVSRGGR